MKDDRLGFGVPHQPELRVPTCYIARTFFFFFPSVFLYVKGKNTLWYVMKYSATCT